MAYAKLGIDTESKQLPAARSLFMADSGQTDGEVNRTADIETEHPNLVRIEVPVNWLEAVALSCNKTVKADLDSISRMRVGIKIGNLYAERLTQKMPAVVKLADETRLLDLLLANRLDVLIINRTLALSLKREPRYNCLTINDPPLLSVPLYHYLHKRHADIVPDITRVLREMHDSGESKAIRERILQSLIAP